MDLMTAELVQILAHTPNRPEDGNRRPSPTIDLSLYSAGQPRSEAADEAVAGEQPLGRTRRVT